MKYILLQIKTDTTAVSALSSGVSSPNNFWFWLSIIELVIILFLVFKLSSKKKNLAFSDLNKENLRKSKETDIDMGNLMNSINNSSELYKELSRKCHPDRFVNSPDQKLAEEIFQEIARHKRNHEKLIALKERAIAELNIKF
jgi:hypothetical protein